MEVSIILHRAKYLTYFSWVWGFVTNTLKHIYIYTCVTFASSQTFYDVGLYWVGSIVHSMIILTCGIALGISCIFLVFAFVIC